MSQKKHIHFWLRQTGVFLFFFLNCFLIFPSSINASSVNNNNHPGCPVQNQNGQESEKDSCSFNFQNEPSEYSLSRRNKPTTDPVVKKKDGRLHESENLNHHSLKDFSPEFSFLIRPGYYTLLFLYQLF